MSRRKLINFEKNRNNPLVVEPGKELFLTIRGSWNASFFEKPQPIVLEIGCGRGEYTVGLAQNFHNKNFIGVDIKGSRIWKGAEHSLLSGLKNVAFVRNKVENIQQQFKEGEVSEIWITFPDPRPRSRDERKRLTSPRFLRLYSMMASEHGAIIHLKTDDDGIYEYTLSIVKDLGLNLLANTDDLYSSRLKEEHFGIQTTYEKKFLATGKTIKYARFKLPPPHLISGPLFDKEVIPLEAKVSDIGFYQSFSK